MVLKQHVLWQASLVAQLGKNPPVMQETWVCSLGWENPLEKGKATHSSILAWKIPWMEEPGRLQSMGSQSQTQLSNFNFNISPSNEYSGFVSFKVEWFDLLAVQGTLKSLIQRHS